MIMYGVYNSDTLTAQLTKSIICKIPLHGKKKTFAGKLNQIYQVYLNKVGAHNFAINSVLFLTTMREKYVKM